MTASAAIDGRAETATAAVRLGSFAIGRRLADDAASRVGIVVLEAIGASESTFADRAATVRCLPPNSIDGPAAVRAKSEFARLRGLRHPAIAPILEAGVANGTTFIAEAQPAGIRLSQQLVTNGKLPAARVRTMVVDVGSALTAMHGAELTHGWISPSTVWVNGDGAATLSGFVGFGSGSLSGPGTTVSGQNASEDQVLLAQTAFAALTGNPFRLHPRLPDSVQGIPTGVVSVLARAAAVRSADRYPTVDSFVRAFDTAMTYAADDLIAGAWEATGRGDLAMGQIMIEMAEGFAPDHPDLGVLRVRLGSGAPGADPNRILAGLMETGFTEPAAVPMDASRTRTADEEAAIAALLTPPRLTPSTSKSNPWLGFIAGTFICILLFVVAAAVTLFYV